MRDRVGSRAVPRLGGWRKPIADPSRMRWEGQVGGKMRTTLARWLVVGSLAGFGLLVGADVVRAQEPTPTPTPTPVVFTADAAVPSSAPTAPPVAAASG